MNILDFDNTIYNGDTSKDIIFYSITKHPFLLMESLFKCIKKYIKYKNQKATFEEVKTVLFSFLFKINNLENYIDNFVNSKMHNIKAWYKNRNKDNDIIISESLEVWIKPFCKKLGIKNVIATKVDNKGNIIGCNCSDDEKVKRLFKEFPNIKIKEAYSDSKSDIPILQLTKNSYVVKGENLIKYTKDYKF